MDTEVRENHELREELEAIKAERDDAQRELRRVAAREEATAHYDHMLSLGQPKDRLDALCITLQQLWLECEQDAELCKRIDDGQTFEILRTVTEGLAPAMQLLRDMGFGKVKPGVIPAKDFLRQGPG